jgi:Holliday junction resolvasome RuvABC ATP-dependent DNA helicase subunit
MFAATTHGAAFVATLVRHLRSSRPGQKRHKLGRAKNSHDELRPRTLADFVGQTGVRSNLRVFIEAAKARHGAMAETG